MQKINLPNEEIKMLYLKGMGSTEIAEKFNCDPITIRKRLKSIGVKIRKRSNLRRSIISIPDRDALIYFAGILDGEGSIPNLRVVGSRDFKHVEVDIANNSLELMEWLVSCFGGKYEHKTMKHGTTAQWQWRVRRLKDVFNLLIAVEPFLIIKKKRAIEVINYLDNRLGFIKEKTQ